MGGPSGESEPVIGHDGFWYYTVPRAATLLGVSPDTIRREFCVVPTSGLVDLPRTPGRPPTHVVAAELVDLRRTELLRKLEVEPVPADQDLRELRRTVRELQSRYGELVDDYRRLNNTVIAQTAELESLRGRHLSDVESERQRLTQ